MAGANNKAMKAAGLPKKTMDTARVALGAGMTVQSAIRHAQAHGLPLGKAAKHAGELSGWQRAAAGGVSPAEKAAASAAREAYVAGQARKAALGAAMAKRQSNLTKSIAAATDRTLTTRLVRQHMTKLYNRQEAAKQAKPQFKGAGPFNAERHFARAEAALTKREDHAKQLKKRLDGLLTAKAPARDIAAAYTAHKKAAAAQDKAFDRYASAKERVDTAREAAARTSAVKQDAAGRAEMMQRSHAAIAAAATKKFKGAGPFNVDRHKARAMALSDARKAQLKAADAKLQAAKTPEERATANKAYNLAQRRADNAAALNRGASAKVSERDAVRRGEKGTRDAQMRQFRSDLSGMRAPGKGQAHIMTAEGPKVVDTVASSKSFFVHKEPGYGGQFVVSHRDTGMAISQSNTLSGAKRIMDGMKKTGHLTMRRLEQGGPAGERAARAMAKYLSAPKRRNVSLAERGLRAGTAPTRRGKEANAAAGIR